MKPRRHGIARRFLYVLLIALWFPTSVFAVSCPSAVRGMSGSDVFAVQKILFDVYEGFPSPTGYFGAVTEAALKQWQREHGIEPLGVVGPKTAAAMKLCVGVSTSATNTLQTTTSSSPDAVAALIEALLAQVKVLQQKLALLRGAQASSSTIPSIVSTISPAQTGNTGPVSSPVASSAPAGSVSAPAPTSPAGSNTPPAPAGRVTSQAGLSLAPTLAYPSSEVLDFLIPDVCVDDANVPISGDPATCARHRDMRFGEFIPYIHTDSSSRGSASSWFGFPTQAPDGSMLVMNVFDWGGFLSNTAYKDFDISNPSDGVDIIEVNGSHASIIATQNNVQPLSPLWNPSCTHDDTWKLFPVNLATGDVGTATSSLAFGQSCPSAFATALNVWHYYGQPQLTTYTSGKKLGSLVEWHYDNANPTEAGSFEQLYFTKEYGVTRWEAWQTVDHCLSAIVPNTPGLTAAYCTAGRTPQCNGADTLSNVWGKNYIRVDCHDLTYVKDYDIPFNPLAVPAGGSLVLSKNILRSGDFAQGQVAGWQAPGSAPLIRTTEQDADHNWHLKVQCAPGCPTDSRSIYQDAPATSLQGKLRLMFGAILGATKSSDVTLSIHILNVAGTQMGGKDVVMQAGSAAHRDDALDWDFDAQPATTIRYEITFNDPSVSYTIDEAYLTPVRI